MPFGEVYVVLSPVGQIAAGLLLADGLVEVDVNENAEIGGSDEVAEEDADTDADGAGGVN
jgi:hypothetical protein